jgi:5-methylcytosine-specific restriction enzyme subunit McrC
MNPEVYVGLLEQAESIVSLSDVEAEYLENLRFYVVPSAVQDEGMRSFIVNPLQYVGHFRLPSGRFVTIRPKVPTASVLRMLAYVYLRWNYPLFHADEVNYSAESFLFEPLVRLFNDLVASRAERGLLQDYIRHEENRPVLRGRLLFREHIQQNTGNPNRAFCRSFENTVDIPDNQMVKQTLHVLISARGWTRQTSDALRANLHQFEGVSLVPLRTLHFGAHHYHRLNQDYLPIHELCALFLATTSISEKPGQLPFKGFLLDMNVLFEKFVERAFIVVGRDFAVSIQPQRSERLSDGEYVPMIQPDIIVTLGGIVVAIVDAKYKRDAFGPANSDLFQVVTYGTALRCTDTYLFYPETELCVDRRIPIRNSPIVVNTSRVGVSGPDCVLSAERSARLVIKQSIDTLFTAT